MDVGFLEERRASFIRCLRFPMAGSPIEFAIAFQVQITLHVRKEGFCSLICWLHQGSVLPAMVYCSVLFVNYLQ
jgi:hypothetical protein